MFPSALVPFRKRRVEARIDDLLSAELPLRAVYSPPLGTDRSGCAFPSPTGGKHCARPFAIARSWRLRRADDRRCRRRRGPSLELVHTFSPPRMTTCDAPTMRRGTTLCRSVRASPSYTVCEASRGRSVREWRSSSATSRSPMHGAHARMPDPRYVVFDELARRVCVGQSLDLAGTGAAITAARSANRIAVLQVGKSRSTTRCTSALHSPAARHTGSVVVGSAPARPMRFLSATICSALRGLP